MKTIKNEKPQKIDFEKLIIDYRVSDKCSLLVYLREVWKDLRTRSEEPTLGVNYHTFYQVSYKEFNTLLVLSSSWYNFRKIIFCLR